VETVGAQTNLARELPAPFAGCSSSSAGTMLESLSVSPKLQASLSTSTYLIAAAAAAAAACNSASLWQAANAGCFFC